MTSAGTQAREAVSQAAHRGRRRLGLVFAVAPAVAMLCLGTAGGATGGEGPAVAGISAVAPPPPTGEIVDAPVAAITPKKAPAAEPGHAALGLPSHGHASRPFQYRPLTRLARTGDSGGRLKLVYGRLSDGDHREFEKAFREQRVFEDVLESLNGSLVLPRDLKVRLEECGEINAAYDPETKSVQLCYELFDHFLQLFGSEAESDADREEAVGKSVAALSFAFYHELGHALIDFYNLPVTGKEEDAVDQLATVMLLETWEGEDSELAILASAEWFDLDAREDSEPNLADEHSLDKQRYYNLVCWIYGSDPDYFSDVAKDWELPDGRAVRCAEEYSRMSTSWDTLLGPHMRPTG